MNTEVCHNGTKLRQWYWRYVTNRPTTVLTLLTGGVDHPPSSSSELKKKVYGYTSINLWTSWPDIG